MHFRDGNPCNIPSRSVGAKFGNPCNIPSRSVGAKFGNPCNIPSRSVGAKFAAQPDVDSEHNKRAQKRHASLRVCTPPPSKRPCSQTESESEQYPLHLLQLLTKHWLNAEVLKL